MARKRLPTSGGNSTRPASHCQRMICFMGAQDLVEVCYCCNISITLIEPNSVGQFSTSAMADYKNCRERKPNKGFAQAGTGRPAPFAGPYS